MQEIHVKALSDEISEIPESAKKRDLIRAAFANADQRGEILTLTTEESSLLEKFRMWRASPRVAGDVFHFRVGLK
jgi:hypothetical protein